MTCLKWGQRNKWKRNHPRDGTKIIFLKVISRWEVNFIRSNNKNVFKSAIESIDKIACNVREEELILQSENDWKFVAMVIDRCFLWIFVLVCIVGTTTLFVQPLGKINNEWVHNSTADYDIKMNLKIQLFSNSTSVSLVELGNLSYPKSLVGIPNGVKTA